MRQDRDDGKRVPEGCTGATDTCCDVATDRSPQENCQSLTGRQKKISERMMVMNSIKKEDIILPDYEELMGCIYENFLSIPGQEFDYENYSKALDRIGQIASGQDYNELECTITDACQNSARHGFLMGARLTMVMLSGWQQGSGMEELWKSLAARRKSPGGQQASCGSSETVKVMEFMKGGNSNGQHGIQ